jgi:hypothetical protein
MLPAGVIDRIDYNDRKVYVNLIKDEIRQAPATTPSGSARRPTARTSGPTTAPSSVPDPGVGQD